MKIVSSAQLLPYVLLTSSSTGYIKEERFASRPDSYISDLLREMHSNNTTIDGYALCVLNNYVYSPEKIITLHPAASQSLVDYISRTLNRKEK